MKHSLPSKVQTINKLPPASPQSRVPTCHPALKNFPGGGEVVVSKASSKAQSEFGKNQTNLATANLVDQLVALSRSNLCLPYQVIVFIGLFGQNRTHLQQKHKSFNRGKICDQNLRNVYMEIGLFTERLSNKFYMSGKCFRYLYSVPVGLIKTYLSQIRLRWSWPTGLSLANILFLWGGEAFVLVQGECCYKISL